MMIRILLVDDHTILREALRSMLEQDPRMQVVGETGDGETALQMAQEYAPDVIVMDIAMRGLSGIETTRRLRAKHPGMKVLALSTHVERGIVMQMLDAGANGYISKSAAGNELMQGIRAVTEGRGHLCPEVAALLADDMLGGARGPTRFSKNSLTQREVQVVTLLAQGKTSLVIADELHISPRTVEVHRRNLMNKLDVHNVVDLIKTAIRAGIILP